MIMRAYLRLHEAWQQRVDNVVDVKRTVLATSQRCDCEFDRSRVVLVVGLCSCSRGQVQPNILVPSSIKYANFSS